MMTGEKRAHGKKRIAKKVGVDEYYAEVLPEDKAKLCGRKKSRGT